MGLWDSEDPGLASFNEKEKRSSEKELKSLGLLPTSVRTVEPQIEYVRRPSATAGHIHEDAQESSCLKLSKQFLCQFLESKGGGGTD